MTVIAAVDFSRLSVPTAQVAARWAARLHEPLELLHVVNPPPALPHEISAGLGAFSGALKEAAERELAKLQRQVEQSRADAQAAPIAITTRVMFGKPEHEVTSRAAALATPLLVVGSHGRGGAARLFIGSVAERIVHHARGPVLVVPEHAAAQKPGEAVARLVVALDTGRGGRATRTWVAALRERQPCDVTFVHAFDARAEHRRLGIDGPYEEMGDHPELLAVLRRELEPLLALPGAGKTELVLRSAAGHRPDPLVFEAETENADLIVTSTGRSRGHHGADQTLRQSEFPVLCVPAAAESAIALATTIPPLRRVLVATDLSALGNQAVLTAYQLLREAGGVVELCHIVGPDGVSEADERRLESELAATAPLEAETRGIRTRLHVLPALSTQQAILQAAERLAADVIVLASHGRGGLGKAVLGSVADGVIRGSSRPVLVVGPKNESR